MARKLSVRKREPGVFEVGPAGRGPAVVVTAPTRKVALQVGKADLRARDAAKGASGHDGFRAAVANSYRFTADMNTTR